MYSFNKFIYIILFSFALFASEGYAQTSTPTITVSVSYDGPASIYESTVERQSRIGNQINYTLGDNRIRFILSLSRALTGGEALDVGLNIVGERGFDINDLVTPSLTLAPGRFGVSLADTDTLNPHVRFRFGSPTTAGLVLRIRNDEILEEDINLSVVIGATSATNTLRVIRDNTADRFSVRLMDDEYTFCFDRSSDIFDENIGTAELGLRVAGPDGVQRRLPRDSSINFSYRNTTSTAYNNLDSVPSPSGRLSGNTFRV